MNEEVEIKKGWGMARKVIVIILLQTLIGTPLDTVAQVISRFLYVTIAGVNIVYVFLNVSIFWISLYIALTIISKKLVASEAEKLGKILCVVTGSIYLIVFIFAMGTLSSDMTVVAVLNVISIYFCTKMFFSKAPNLSSMTKKRWAALVGGLVSIVILFFAGEFIYGSTINGSALDQESKAWVESIAPGIITNWDSNAILADASPQFLQSVSTTTLEQFTNQLRTTFGPLKKHDAPQGESGIHINNYVTTITAEYVIDADYANTSTRIFIQGIKTDGEWKLLMLYVDPDPSLRWFDGHLINQPTSSPEVNVNGATYHRLVNW